MPVYRYGITKSHCADENLLGLIIEVETLSSPGFTVNHDGLREWCLRIAGMVISAEIEHNGLIDEGVHIRLSTDTGRVIVDTISERERRE